MMVTVFFEAVHKKLISGQKKQRFWAQKGPLWAIGIPKRPAKQPSTGNTEGVQSYLRIMIQLS